MPYGKKKVSKPTVAIKKKKEIYDIIIQYPGSYCDVDSKIGKIADELKLQDQYNGTTLSKGMRVHKYKGSERKCNAAARALHNQFPGFVEVIIK